jgi:hypothetical protein
MHGRPRGGKGYGAPSGGRAWPTSPSMHPAAPPPSRKAWRVPKATGYASLRVRPEGPGMPGAALRERGLGEERRGSFRDSRETWRGWRACLGLGRRLRGTALRCQEYPAMGVGGAGRPSVPWRCPPPSSRAGGFCLTPRTDRHSAIPGLRHRHVIVSPQPMGHRRIRNRPSRRFLAFRLSPDPIIRHHAGRWSAWAGCRNLSSPIHQ